MDATDNRFYREKEAFRPLCECTMTCEQLVDMDGDTYLQKTNSGPGLYIILPGHEAPTDIVVERTEKYLVVRDSEKERKS